MLHAFTARFGIVVVELDAYANVLMPEYRIVEEAPVPVPATESSAPGVEVPIPRRFWLLSQEKKSV